MENIHINYIYSLLLVIFLISPVFGWDVFWNLFGEKRDYTPGSNYKKNNSYQPDKNERQMYVSLPLRAQSQSTNILEDIQNDTPGWQCIKEILYKEAKDVENFTLLLSIAVREDVVDKIKDCYVDNSEGNSASWWDDFIQTDFWKFLTDFYWYIIIAVVATVTVLLLLCKLCCVICKNSNDEDYIR